MLEMLPYPSGEPHIGHLKNYSIGDAVAHFHRRQGMRVLHPMGYDAFGLPAENHAISTGQPPRESTDAAIASFQRQFREWGISIDWSREFGTHEPRYYRWTQWIFLQALRARPGLPRRGGRQVVPPRPDGPRQRAGHRRALRALRPPRGGAPARAVVLPHHRLRRPAPRRPRHDRVARARQDDAAQLDRALGGRRGHLPQRGARGSTTRSSPRGRTPSSARRSSSWRPSTPTCSVSSRAPSSSRRSTSTSTTCSPRATRTAATPTARRPASSWAATSSTRSTASGCRCTWPTTCSWSTAPARSWPSRLTTSATTSSRASSACRSARSSPAARTSRPRPYTGDGPLVNSHSDFDGLPNREALERIVVWLDREGKGHASVNYRLRDWLLSRQRYWGCPIPIIHCERCGIVPVPEDQLPVLLPDVADYAPKGRSPLAAAEDWVNVDVPVLRRPGAARDRHDGHLRRLVLVLPALLRRRQRRGCLGPRRAARAGCRSTSTSAASSTRSCT